MISKEAELFEKANIVDIGLQPSQFAPRRNSSGENVANNSNNENTSTSTTPPLQGIENLNIDEVDKVDNNIIVDEAYQRSLDERAHQFMLNDGMNNVTSSFPPIVKPKVQYNYTDKFTLYEEIENWFTPSEKAKLPLYQKLYDSRFNVNFYDLSFDEREDLVRDLTSTGMSTKPDDLLRNFECLISISTGYFGQDLEPTEILRHITKNNEFFVKTRLISWAVNQLVAHFDLASEASSINDMSSHILFHCCTLLYLITLVGIDSSDKLLIQEMQTQFEETDMLIVMLKLIDQWRWNNRNTVRIRNIIIMFAKIFKFQIGGLEYRDEVKTYLEKKFNIHHRQEDPNELTASPIDFHIYRQELTTRYPSFIPPPSKVPSDFEDSSSLTHYISIPKNQLSKQINTAQTQAQPIHIATPAPSPSNSPIGSSKILKGKRINQTGYTYPFIYPTEEGHTDVIPRSIQEATDLFSSRVRDKLHLFQLWDEFDYFLKQERGWTDSLTQKDVKFNYSNVNKSESTNETRSLYRVEAFYESGLPFFSSLVHVLLEVILSAQTDFLVLKNSKSLADNKQYFNIIRAKSTVLKESSYLLVLMLKWFKVNHILKYEHLSSLIYDSNFYMILIQYLKSFDDEILDRIQNTSLKNTAGAYMDVDDYFCFTLHNLLTVASKITNKKTQRVVDLSDKDATSILRQVLSFYNKDLWKPALKLLKEIAPLKKKQWKAKNMDLISLVYLHGQTSLRDNWLSGRDVDAELGEKFGQEVALRSLIQFYNLRKYSASMEQLGYSRSNFNYFTRNSHNLSEDV